MALVTDYLSGIQFNSFSFNVIEQYRYSKLAELKNNMMHLSNGELKDDDISEDTVVNYTTSILLLSFRCSNAKLRIFSLQSPELHIYTDFLRIVLEILNAILTYALPRNPEVSYIMYK